MSSLFASLASQVVIEEEQERLRLAAAPVPKVTELPAPAAGERTEQAIEHRGNAPEDLGKRAKENVTELRQPAAIQEMKKGPANLDKDKAGAAAEIPANLKKSMDGLEKIRSEKENITAQIEALKEKLGAGAVDVKFQAAIEEVAKAMEDVPGHVGKMGDKLVSLDFERKIKTAKLSKETEGKISKLNARIDKARRVMKRLADTVEAIQAESFERLGGEETVKPRVAVFPKPGVKSAFAELSMLSVAIMSPAQRERLMRVEASLLSMFKSLVSSVKDFVKSLAGIDDLEEDLAESIKKDMADAPAAA